jgi:hypothetical protein
MDGVAATRLRLDAIAELRRNSESRRKLFGWDAQREDAYSYEQFVGALRLARSVFMETVSDTELRRLYALRIRQRLPPVVVSDLDAVVVQPEQDNNGTGGEAA